MPRRILLALSLTLALLGCGEGDHGGGAGPVSPAPEAVAHSLALQNRGLALLERYDYSQAVEVLEQAWTLTPDWAAAKFHLALAYQHAGDETRSKALEMMREIAAAHPDNVHALFAVGILAENAGRTDEALDHYRRAFASTSDPIIGAKFGALLLSMDMEDEALTVLSDVHAERPMLIAPVNSLQLLYRRRGETERADELLALLRQLKGGMDEGRDWIPVGEEFTDAYGNLGRYSRADPRFGGVPEPMTRGAPTATVTPLAHVCGALPPGAPPYVGLAAFDYDGDGDLDLFFCGGDADTSLLRNDGGLAFSDVTDEAGVRFAGAYAVAAGELDVDPKVAAEVSGRDTMIDLVLVFPDRLRVLRNRGDGTFADVTAESGLAEDPGGARGVLLFDADHEGDLDLLLTGDGTWPGRLYANRGPGTFVQVEAALSADVGPCGPAVVFDADDDRDLDVLVTRPGAPPVLYLNDRLLRFHVADGWVPAGADATHGAFVGDFDRDGRDDVFLAGETGATWLRGTGAGFEPQVVADAPGGAAIPLDVHLGGDVDALFSDGTLLAGQPGERPFGVALRLLDTATSTNLLAADLDADGAEEVVLHAPGAAARLVALAAEGRGNGLVLDFRGVIRNSVQAGWSNVEGRDAWVEVKAGALWQGRRVGGVAGYGVASPTREVFGIGPRAQAEFVRVLWTDAVQQGVLDVPVGAPYLVVEEQRRPDSCPLLFAWDGRQFRWITDFLGAGGLGFLIAPGVYAQPDPTESVKVAAGECVPDEDGRYVFKLVEAMEEMVYLDAIDAQVVDHPADVSVHPDERFTGEEPMADGHLLAHRAEILPVAARDGRGRDVLDSVTQIDRVYSEEPGLHPRLTGAIDESVLELDFGARLAATAPGDPLVLFLHGWIEYGYTRTSVAADGEGFEYVLPALDAYVEGADGGAWRTLVPNIGYPAGFPRVMTYDVSGLVSRETPRLRIRTNLEIYWDRVWLASPIDVAATCRVTVLPAESATLARVGYPREYSPDGGYPRIYDYHTRDESMPWKTVFGDYTRFGDVLPLLTDADDRYVIYGKAEEIDVRFDARGLPPLPEGWVRDIVLRTTGWCKGQELYIAHADTVGPLPFLGMSGYPYGADEAYPDDAEHRAYREKWYSRHVRQPVWSKHAR